MQGMSREDDKKEEWFLPKLHWSISLCELQ
jgi:hypothetical protein